MKNRTKPYFVIVFIFWMSVLVQGCMDPDGAQKDKIIADINGYRLTLEDYEEKLVQEMEYDRKFKATEKARTDFLNTLIRKEILVQGAIRRKLDKRPEFTQAIEKYWEATLIKSLMEDQARQIEKTTYVTEDEIQTEYDRLKKNNKRLLPLEHMEKDIADQIKSEKKTTLLDQWMTALVRNAAVQINHKHLKRTGDQNVQKK